MPLADKYKPVIDLIDELSAEDKFIEEERGSLIIKASFKNQAEIKLVQNKINEVNKINASDIKTDFKIRD